MSSNESERLVDDYLKRLRKASRHLPRADRAELIAQIEEHLADALPAEATPTVTRAILAQLGDPEGLVSEQRTGLAPALRHAGFGEWLIIALLLFGGFIVFFGWFVGVWLLWWSHAWMTSEKLVGTLALPGGLVVAAALVQRLIGSSGNSIGIGILTVCAILATVLPFLTAAFLARRAQPTLP
jgi:hypothetical protein